MMKGHSIFMRYKTIQLPADNFQELNQLCLDKHGKSKCKLLVFSSRERFINFSYVLFIEFCGFQLCLMCNYKKISIFVKIDWNKFKRFIKQSKETMSKNRFSKWILIRIQNDRNFVIYQTCPGIDAIEDWSSWIHLLRMDGLYLF